MRRRSHHSATANSGTLFLSIVLSFPHQLFPHLSSGQGSAHCHCAMIGKAKGDRNCEDCSRRCAYKRDTRSASVHSRDDAVATTVSESSRCGRRNIALTAFSHRSACVLFRSEYGTVAFLHAATSAVGLHLPDRPFRKNIPRKRCTGSTMRGGTFIHMASILRRYYSVSPDRRELQVFDSSAGVIIYMQPPFNSHPPCILWGEARHGQPAKVDRGSAATQVVQ